MHRNHEVSVGELLLRRTLSVREMGSVRATFSGWAVGQGIDADTVDEITLSGYEAVANCVEHGYRGQDSGVVEVYADHQDGRVIVTVVDHGQWQPPTEPGIRGRGLVLIHGLSTHTTVTSSAAGTTVTMTWLPERRG